MSKCGHDMKWIGRKTQHQNTMSCVFLWLHKITRFLEVIYDQSSSIWPDPEVRIRSSKVRLQRLLVKARRRAWTSLLSMIQLQFSVCGMIDSSTHIYTHTYKHKHTHTLMYDAIDFCSLSRRKMLWRSSKQTEWRMPSRTCACRVHGFTSV